MQCSQCEKVAVFTAEPEGMPLCVDHFFKLQQALNLEQSRIAVQHNLIADQMDAVTGLYGLTPRMAVPQPTLHTGPTSFQSVNIKGGQVGAVNFGHIDSLAVSFNRLEESDQAQLAKALKHMTAAILESKDLDADKKNTALESLTFLAEQATVPQQTRKKTIVRSALENLGKVANAASNLSTIWNALKPLLEALL